MGVREVNSSDIKFFRALTTGKKFMSDRYVKEVDVVESSSSTALIVLVVAIIAIAVIAMVMWQPWTSSVPPSSSTTIIREGQQQPAPDNRPIIVNPPPATQGDTKIDIRNEVPPVKDPPIIDNSNNSATNDSNVDKNESK